MALDVQRIKALAAQPDDTIPELTGEQVRSVATLLGAPNVDRLRQTG